MSIINHIDRIEYYKDKCPCCQKEFFYTETEQIPGFRDKDYLWCPYCKKEIRSSMEYEYSSYKKEEIE